MKKINKNERYLQVKDIVFISKNNIAKIPISIWQRVLQDDIAINAEDLNKYIFINKKEYDFFDSLDWLLEENELYSIDIELLNGLVNRLKENLNENDLERKILEYNITAINEIINKKEHSLLDELGRPKGYETTLKRKK